MGDLFLAILLATAAPERCAVPDAPPRTVSVAAPETPEIARQGNLSGTVSVIVALNERSEVVKTEVLASTNAVFNRSAERAARDATFRTEIVDCLPRAAAYVFVVQYSGGQFGAPAAPALPTFEPGRYLDGTWSCRAGSDSPTTERFSVESADGITRTSGVGSESYTRDADGKWHLKTADGRDLMAKSAWGFRGTQDGRPVSITYTRIDADTFRRLSSALPGQSEPYRLETCKRVKS